jgi:hypothetical protein
MLTAFACLDSATLYISGEASLGDLLVAFGTLLLAVFTYLLARRTNHAVGVSEQGVALNRESIEASERPFLIATPDANHSLLGFTEPGSEHPGWRFIYRLWNLGRGPAIVDGMSLIDIATGYEYLTTDEQMERPVAMNPPVYDGLSRLSANIPPAPSSNLILRISYRSASGQHYVSTSTVIVTENLSCICSDFRREAVS